jgi:hypothetical protein
VLILAKAKMTKKKIVDLVAYAVLLIHNNKIEEVMTDEQIDFMMQTLTKMFDNDEEKAIRFIQNKVESLVKDLEEYRQSAK